MKDFEKDFFTRDTNKIRKRNKKIDYNSNINRKLTTYILFCKQTINGEFYVKFGVTTNWKQRKKAYLLHNPLIDFALTIPGDFEHDLLTKYNSFRIDNKEWIVIQYNPYEEIKLILTL